LTDRIFEAFAPSYWAAGLPVIPLRHRNKMPDITQWSKYGSMMPTQTEQMHWLASFPRATSASHSAPRRPVCDRHRHRGRGADCAILDVLPPTPWTRVGKKGMGLIYRFEGQRNFKLRGADGEMILEFWAWATRWSCLPRSTRIPGAPTPRTATCGRCSIRSRRAGRGH
jgi:hypothetical protein